MKRKVSILLSGVLMLSLTACGGNQASAPETTEAAKAVAAAETTAEEKGTYTPGTYTAVGKGFGGDVEVTVTVDGSSITETELVSTDGKRIIGIAMPVRMPKMPRASSLEYP